MKEKFLTFFDDIHDSITRGSRRIFHARRYYAGQAIRHRYTPAYVFSLGASVGLSIGIILGGVYYYQQSTDYVHRKVAVQRPQVKLNQPTQTPQQTAPTASTGGTSGSTSTSPTAQSGFGIAFGGNLPWLSSPELNKELDDAKTMGFTWLRMDFAWENLQPDNASSYSNLSNYDAVVTAAGMRGIRVLGTIAYTPGWARPSGCSSDTCAPSNNAQYAAFASTLAKHYGPMGVHAWEIWNEPNLAGFWKPSPSASAYTAMLKATYPAIKAADSSAVVVTGGISSSDEQSGSIEQLAYLNGLYGAGAKPYFDAVGYHPYSFPALPTSIQSWSGWSKITDLKTSLRSIMVANTDGAKQIWSTEFGAPTGGPGALAGLQGYDPAAGEYYVSEDLQSKMASEAISKTKATSFAGPLFWYSYKDQGTDMSDMENFFGILRADGSHKPVFNTFQQIL